MGKVVHARRIAVNSKNPSEIYEMVDTKEVLKDKVPFRFVTYSLNLLKLCIAHPQYAKLISYIVLEMDRSNLCHMTVKSIAEGIGEHEITTGRKLKELANLSVVHRNGKNIMVNPYFATKCRAAFFKQLEYNWFYELFEKIEGVDKKPDPELDMEKLKETLLQLLAGGAAT